jgi:transposase
METTIIGVDLAKNVFQVHGATETGVVTFRKKLTRIQFRKFITEHKPVIVAMEACGSAHYWAREAALHGHIPKLLPSQYVKPFVKRQKNDAADAEAIVIAAQRPEMRFVEPKTESQQAKVTVFRARERLVHQRTQLVNALRAGLYEFGIIAPTGIYNINRLDAFVEDNDCNLPDLAREEFKDLLVQIYEITERIEAKLLKLKKMAKTTDVSRCLQTMPGVGPITAVAIEALAPDMSTFRCGRDFAAWLGLVPKQYSSGGVAKLGSVSKAGQADIRRLLIIGAMSRIGWIGRKTIPENSWLSRLLERKPKMLVAIALANKMARAIWAMLTNKEDYKVPVFN